MVEGETTEPGVSQLAAELHRPLCALMMILRRREISRVRSRHITVSQLSILTTLLNDGALRMAQLSEHEGVRAPPITVAIRRLEALGLVERFHHPSAHRSVLVGVTPKGLGV